MIIFKYIYYLALALITFILLHAVAMAILNTICNCANDYNLTNLW